jgi:hypothetical protein
MAKKPAESLFTSKLWLKDWLFNALADAPADLDAGAIETTASSACCQRSSPGCTVGMPTVRLFWSQRPTTSLNGLHRRLAKLRSLN